MTARVLLDCDGVLSDFVGGWLRLINAHHGTSWTPDDVTEWDICTSLGIKERAQAARLLADCPNFAATLHAYPAAVDAVHRLREIAEVYIVTSPWNSHPTWTFDREKWLKRNFDIPSSHVVHTSAKHICVGDVLVDDRTETLAKWLEHHPTGTAVQWQTPHNRRDRWNGWSTNSWDELFRIVQFARPMGTEVVA